jgi:CRP/FNR family transcriptional regulator
MNQIMSTAISDKAEACNNCSFSPFCLSQPKSIRHSAKIDQLARQHRYYKKRQVLCGAQEKFKCFYIVKSGALKAFDLEIEGRERILGFYLPGEVVGFEALDKNTYPFSVMAIKDTVVCEVKYDDLMAVIDGDLYLQQQLLRLNSQRMNMGSYITYVRAEQRLIGFLVELAERFYCNESAAPGFTLPVSRQAIGDYLGLAPETIIRIIGRLHQQGVLLADKKQIRLYDLPKLRWLMHGGLLKDFHH